MIQIGLTLCVMSILIIGIIEVVSYDAMEEEVDEIRDELEALEE